MIASRAHATQRHSSSFVSFDEDVLLAPLAQLAPLVSRRVNYRQFLSRLIEAYEGPCPIPGHTGEARVDVPGDDPDGEPRVLCCKGRWRSPAEVRAGQGYGRDVRIRNTELVVWHLRLAYELGDLEPLPVLVPDVRTPRTQVTRELRRGFQLLIGLRWLDGKQTPVPFAASFALAWTGVSCSRPTAARAIEELEGSGVIHEAERIGRLRLWLPGGARG